MPTAAPTTAPSGTIASEAEVLLLSYVGEAFRESCARSRQIYPTELASITCGPDDFPYTFTLFGKAADLQAAYDQDLPRARTRPAADGTCAEANFEATYKIDDAVAGRIACRDRISSSNGVLFREMEWTNDELLVLGFISNRVKTWDEMIDFWTNDAGPYPPG